MKKIVASLIVLVSLTSVLAQPKRIGTFKFQKRSGAHTAKVIIHTRAFDPSNHLKTYDQKSGRNLIDGRVAYGAEGTPQAEIASIRFYFDGKAMTVPKGLFADCYDPNFDSGLLKLTFSRDRQRVLVTMWGADGAGAYGVVWVLRRNGHHSRYFRDAF